MAVHASDTITSEMEVGGSRVQSQSLAMQFEVSVGYNNNKCHQSNPNKTRLTNKTPGYIKTLLKLIFGNFHISQMNLKEILCVIDLFLVSWETSTMICKVAVQVCTVTNNKQSVPFCRHLHQHFLFFFFYFSCFDWGNIKSKSSFNLGFSDG